MASWPVQPLEALATVSVGAPSPGKRDGGSVSGTEYEIVSVGSVHPTGIAARESLPRARLAITVSEHKRATLQAGDVLLSARGAALRIALVGVQHAGTLANNTLLVIRSLGVVSGATLYAALRAPRVVHHLEQIARTSTATRAWRPSDVRDIRLPVPPASVQEMVARLIEADEAHQAAARRALDLRHSAAWALLADVLYGESTA